ncbi:hypothetical protein Pcinc_007888 [Petrolisthes cinctipes]|uniref:Uncharacterized protein n=1 Tax=Petrolisthes cinctipes TaxID=88211 RepID=A0AAE1G8E8_PETCI|nr:hypothetical protein Pcinc_007888 [Petrolisthes cinctipes]
MTSVSPNICFTSVHPLPSTPSSASNCPHVGLLEIQECWTRYTSEVLARLCRPGSAGSWRRAGQGTPKYTERDLWIFNTFAFLKGHNVQQGGRQSSQCSVAARSSVLVTSEEEPDEMPSPAAPTSAYGKKKSRRIPLEGEDIGDLLWKVFISKR